MTLNLEGINICDSTCNECFKEKVVCEECKQHGQTSFFPSLRACKRCLEDGKKCVKAAILIVTVEEGNKKAMSDILEELEKGKRDPFCLSLFQFVTVFTLEKASMLVLSTGI